MRIFARLVLFVLTVLFFFLNGFAQFPYNESFQNATAPGMVIAGSAKLTAASGIDPAGQGYLRLTENSPSNVGYAYCNQSFPSNYGITASFDFFMWKSDALSYNQADGISFFLYDASVNSFRPGGSGGSLGYAQYYSVPGMAKGYLGISMDGFGNFSSATDGTKNGGPGQRRGAVAIRGPGDGKSVTDYVYQTGVIASDAPYNAGYLGFTQRYPLSSSPNYRRVQIALTPGSSLGPTIGYKITVSMIKGGATPTTVTLINNFDYPFIAPSQLKFGLAGSTGSLSNYQEIRNMNISVTNSLVLLPPLVVADAAVVCQGQPAIMDITANDASMNTGGSINKVTIDLDVLTAGRQTTRTVAGQGTFSVDANGIVTFTPLAAFTGISSIGYKVDDNYGVTALLPATITATVSPFSAPPLNINNPAAVCAPQAIDITSASYKSGTVAGTSFSYFNSLTNANNNSGNINASASSITQSGTYYIRAANALGCATVKPIVVQVNQIPTASNAGPDQNFCSSTGSLSATLLANNPDIGAGTWTQVSGPTTATIMYPNAATSPVQNMDKGIYTFRWSIANGACATSVDDIKVTAGILSNAGLAQTFPNASSATLQGNNPSPGTGAWSQVSGPAATIVSPSDPSSSVTGLAPGNNYVFAWKITNGTCTSTTNVSINDILNTVANAGDDKVLADVLGFTMGGNIPGAGNTGTWTWINSPVGGHPAVTDIHDPHSWISIDKVGNYTLRWTIQNGSFSTSDEVQFIVTVVLPVKLISFNGRAENNKVFLSWQTAGEENHDHFEVQRGTDGNQFATIGQVAGRGATSIPQDYSFADETASSFPNRIYYRLKQVDLNGNVAYSPILTIRLELQHTLEIAPNPFHDRISIQFYTGKSGKVALTLYNDHGQQVQEKLLSAMPGVNIVSLEHLDHLPAGIFTIRIITGDAIQFKRIIKL